MGWFWVAVILLALVGQTREYFKFKSICATFLPNRPIQFYYSLSNDNVAGTYFDKVVHVRIHGNHADRLETLYHELGHAATFALPDPDALVRVFDDLGRGPTFRWEDFCVSKYAQTNALEDIAETFSNVMTKFRPWTRVTRLKALAVCDHFVTIGVRDCFP